MARSNGKGGASPDDSGDPEEQMQREVDRVISDAFASNPPAEEDDEETIEFEDALQLGSLPDSSEEELEIQRLGQQIEEALSLPNIIIPSGLSEEQQRTYFMVVRGALKASEKEAQPFVVYLLDDEICTEPLEFFQEVQDDRPEVKMLAIVKDGEVNSGLV